MPDTWPMSDAGDHANPDPAGDPGYAGDHELGHEAHDDHGGGHGLADDHGHGAPDEPLGPVDTQAWAAAIGGSVLAIVVIIALYLTITG
jgi:hypothetical protein